MQSNNLRTKNFWSKGFLPGIYRKYAGGYFAKIHELVTSILLNKSIKNVLDIACGPGDFLYFIKNKNPDLEITGTDIAPGMIEYAKARLGSTSNIVETNAENQPFQDKSFDAVTVMMAFHHFPKKLETLIEIKRILRPNGILIIVDPVAKSNFQTRLWNFFEKIIRVRGYVGHYTDLNLKKLADEVGFSFSSSSIPGMSKRYKICQLISKNH